MTQVNQLTDAERLLEAKRLGDQKAAEKAEEHWFRYKTSGGFYETKKSCYNCKHFSLRGENGKCHNPAASLKGADLKGTGIRLDHGLCGPNAVFFERDTKDRNKVIGRILAVSAIIGAIGTAVALLGPVVVGVIALIIFFLIVFFDD